MSLQQIYGNAGPEAGDFSMRMHAFHGVGEERPEDCTHAGSHHGHLLTHQSGNHEKKWDEFEEGFNPFTNENVAHRTKADPRID